MFAAGFSWLHLSELLGHNRLFELLGLDVAPETGVLFGHACLVALFMIALGIVGRLSLERARSKQGLERYFAEGRLSVRTAFEIYGDGVKNVMGDMLDDDDVRLFFPFVATMFLYLFISNLLGVIPGLLPPTDNINTTFGMAVLVFVLFNAVGLGRDPVAYIKHLAGPMLAVAPMLFVIEVISLVFRPVTLSLRITGNLFGDHTAFAVISDLVPAVAPALMLALATFVSFVQAFIFTLLTTIYIALSVPHAEHEEH